MNTNKHQKAGKKGGLATKQNQPKDHFSMLAKKMHEKRKKREGLLKLIKVEDLSNPVILESVKQKLEQIDAE